ncbi:2-C-methyl-D-erythritol 4-phosphate cytidylyltransferase [Simiduia curdlanivorans]|uniref:2-C-methyl-D-erythritol 4-phosphate cytidylyltransferase n=1 Tax=Simiduia curdlanivorans TaxID=1492769 RepID=A0ABV8UZ59_9GAMM|nr:2-C-methyl-D-erythritol 4-phosphate cytidylyltransferase [Simiduia curdlanivorans]MDN3639212.1 2-C-methyl-D-erythritol 4-phosphate cytidylyltransferase [Simiduia curdlanivorans]
MSATLSPKIWIVVPAAGIGARMGSALPKQYLPLAGSTVLEQTLSVLLRANYLAEIVVCLHRDDVQFDQLASVNHPKIVKTFGGEERSDSVLCGLTAIADKVAPADWVLVHDAARPCLTVQLLNGFIDTVVAQPHGGILAIPVADTLKQVQPSTRQVIATQDRANLWQAQTPQMFQYPELLLALSSAAQNGQAITDEASAIELLGKTVRIIPGSAENIKVTRPEDLRLANLILQANQ